MCSSLSWRWNAPRPDTRAAPRRLDLRRRRDARPKRARARAQTASARALAPLRAHRFPRSGFPLKPNILLLISSSRYPLAFLARRSPRSGPPADRKVAKRRLPDRCRKGCKCTGTCATWAVHRRAQREASRLFPLGAGGERPARRRRRLIPLHASHTRPPTVRWRAAPSTSPTRIERVREESSALEKNRACSRRSTARDACTPSRPRGHAGQRSGFS